MIKSNNKKANQSFKDHYLERKLLISRSFFAFGFVVLMLFALVIRSWYLQVIKFDDFQTRSNDNRISIQPIAPKRGLIYDRNGVLLAENRSNYSLEIIPEEVKNIQDTLDRLQALSLIEDKHKQSFLSKLRGVRRFKSIILKSRLNEKEVAKFAVNQHLFSGVTVEARLIRHYPFGPTIAHAIGRVGRINDRELVSIDQANYKATRNIGKIGLEKFYEDTLHGSIGFRRVETDVQGRVIGKPIFEKLPVPGKNIQLSLDVRLQQVSVSAMKNNRGSVVAIDPRNGEVLALVSNPSYDPNEFVLGISSANYQKLTESKDRPLFNRALRGLYSPGSIIKPHIAWAGLESKTVTTRTTVPDPGYWVIPTKEKRVYRDHQRWGHGERIAMNMAIIQSCDPYFYDLAYKMGIDKLSVYMKQFGFGQYTHIDMGEEVPGIMPSREWKRKDRKANWYPGETVITGIGQGYWIATPLQMANSIAQLGMGAARYQLRVVKAIQRGEGWQYTSAITAEEQANFENQKNLKAVQKSMRSVNQYPYGTARKAFDGAEYESAGKTGTVQLTAMGEEKYDATKIEKRFRDNAVYVGYAPYDSPEIAVAVVVENAGHGGEQAAPIARKVLDEYFANKKADQISTTEKL